MADISEEDLQKEIAAILQDADLSKTSVKKVRQELEKKLGCKLISRKEEIDSMVMEFIENKKKGDDDEEEDEEEEEEEDEEEDDDEDSDSDKKKKRGSTGKKPPAKKSKKAAPKSRPKDDSEDEDSDASEPSKDGDSEEEYSPKKSGKGKPFKTRKLPPKKKKGSESDSDEDWAKGQKAKKGGAKRGGGGYTKQMTLSKELAALVGQESMARHEVVKKMWAIIKEKNLYDPNNKQFAVCDDALFKVIGVKRFRTFGMMKYLKNHFIS